MSLVEVVCDVTVIFGPVPSLEVFRQHFGMGGPLQLLCPQWANGHAFVSECFPEATHGMSS